MPPRRREVPRSRLVVLRVPPKALRDLIVLPATLSSTSMAARRLMAIATAAAATQREAPASSPPSPPASQGTSGGSSGLLSPCQTPERSPPPTVQSPVLPHRARKPSKRRQEQEDVAVQKKKKRQTQVNKAPIPPSIQQSVEVPDSQRVPPSGQRQSSSEEDEVQEVDLPTVRPRHLRDTASLLVAYPDEPLKWTIKWTLTVKREGQVCRISVDNLTMPASRYWTSSLQGDVSSRLFNKGWSSYPFKTLKVRANVPGRRVDALDQISDSVPDWKPLDDKLTIWSIRYPGEAIKAVVDLIFEAPIAPPSSQRGGRRSRTSMMEADLQASRTTQDDDAYLRVIDSIQSRWRCSGHCSQSAGGEGFCWIDDVNQRHAKILAKYWRVWAKAIERGTTTAHDPPHELRGKLLAVTRPERSSDRGRGRGRDEPSTPTRIVIETVSSVARPAPPAVAEPASSPWHRPLPLDKQLHAYVKWLVKRVEDVAWKDAFWDALALLNSRWIDYKQVRQKPVEYLVLAGVPPGIAEIMKRDTELWKADANQVEVVERRIDEEDQGQSRDYQALNESEDDEL